MTEGMLEELLTQKLGIGVAHEAKYERELEASLKDCSTDDNLSVSVHHAIRQSMTYEINKPLTSI